VIRSRLIRPRLRKTVASLAACSALHPDEGLSRKSSVVDFVFMSRALRHRSGSRNPRVSPACLHGSAENTPSISKSP